MIEYVEAAVTPGHQSIWMDEEYPSLGIGCYKVPGYDEPDGDGAVLYGTHSEIIAWLRQAISEVKAHRRGAHPPSRKASTVNVEAITTTPAPIVESENITDLGFYEAVHNTVTGYVRIRNKSKPEVLLCFLGSELLPIARELVFAYYLNEVKK